MAIRPPTKKELDRLALAYAEDRVRLWWRAVQVVRRSRWRRLFDGFVICAVSLIALVIVWLTWDALGLPEALEAVRGWAVLALMFASWELGVACSWLLHEARRRAVRRWHGNILRPLMPWAPEDMPLPTWSEKERRCRIRRRYRNRPEVLYKANRRWCLVLNHAVFAAVPLLAAFGMLLSIEQMGQATVAILVGLSALQLPGSRRFSRLCRLLFARRSRGACCACEYDLRGGVDGADSAVVRCPECGWRNALLAPQTVGS